jgi:hypothetical protein
MTQGLHGIWTNLSGNEHISPGGTDSLSSLDPCPLRYILILGIVHKRYALAFCVIKYKTKTPSKAWIKRVLQGFSLRADCYFHKLLLGNKKLSYFGYNKSFVA